ncbi:unnamed protein product [Miscanthus lutarioriparius]|uniref:Gnk2-homologous domain-containing protein n=1 Tax=Miscanthus lutarioriparius TaxID=422564 RepID=A0A811N3T5_9POAL|nr:unnamed protein product [Miscanthus lutarioriparius]CAD6217802.1 unnamed protein product [Miscanthus lutarioriparius]
MKHLTAMRFFCLLPFLFVLLPLDANGDTRSVICLGRGNSTSINSDYEANIHSLAAMLRSETASATPGLYTEYVVGDLPDGVYAVSRCRNGTDSSSCRACVTLALQEARTACPYHRESAFFNGNCSLRLLPGVHFDDLVLVSSETESVQDACHLETINHQHLQNFQNQLLVSVHPFPLPLRST